MTKALTEAAYLYRNFYGQYATLARFITDLGIPLPARFRMAVDFTLHEDLMAALSVEEPDACRVQALMEQVNRLRKALVPLVEDVCASLRRHSYKARTVSLKLRYSDFTTPTRDKTIEPSNDDAALVRVFHRLLHATLKPSRPVRLLGVRTSGVQDDAQTELAFSTPSEKRERILKAVDELRRKYGDDIIHATQV